MKYHLLVCAGLADEPSEELGGRTALEVSKKPHLDALAQKGTLGVGSFYPASLPASPEVALYSLLGYDPLESYTGLAPLEALALGLDLSDRDVAFRCDLVTVADGKMADPTAGNIPSLEAETLLKDLKGKIETKDRRLYPVESYKNLLLFIGSDKAEELDEMECPPARSIVGQKIASSLPKGKAQRELVDIMHTSEKVLEAHEVNRVRIDLKENPASQLWLWGQGRRPKLAPFKQKQGLDGGFYSETNFVKGFARAAGFEAYKSLDGMGSKPFSFFYQAAPHGLGLKERIKHIEDFDAKIVGPVVKRLSASKEPWRLAVATERRRQHAPVLIAGQGIDARGGAAFNEKNCAQTGVLFDPGHSWLGQFLKN